MTRLTKWSLVAVSFVSSVTSTPLATSPHHSPSYNSPLSLAPLHAFHHPHGTVNNSYIVKFKHDLPQSMKTNHLLTMDNHPNGRVKHIYDSHVFAGYSGTFSEEAVQQLRTKPEVAYVEKDQIVHTTDIQKGAPWGLARISHRPKLSFSTFTKYEYDKDGGEGVDVYIIDTGINIEHEEFQGRASWGTTIPENDVDEDNNGHGTHCAGTIASRKYGVAKKAHVIAVKVLGSNGSGTMSDVIAGVVFAAQHAKSKLDAAQAEGFSSNRTRHRGSVANMSLGGGRSDALNDAVDRAVESGMHFAVAAGNDNRDACLFSPAGAKKAVTVGASTLGDERAYFSNHGKCVDVFAPGLNILSTYIGSTKAVATLSGTSMASPHTAGLLAYLLSIYPSKTFNPVFDETENLVSMTPPESIFTLSPAVYTLARAVLPSWVSSYLQPSFIEITAPIPPKTLQPGQLKQALLKLASNDLLTELPPNTINKLIFNNFTSS